MVLAALLPLLSVVQLPVKLLDPVLIRLTPVQTLILRRHLRWDCCATCVLNVECGMHLGHSPVPLLFYLLYLALGSYSS